MNYSDNPYQSPLGTLAAQAEADERSSFIVKTYLHLAGAIGLFVILEAIFLHLPVTEDLVKLMIGGRISWLVVLGLFIGVSYLADYWARTAVNPAMQYLGLGLYVVAESIIFIPLLFIAEYRAPGAITLAGVATLGLFAIMPGVVFVTRRDFSFLRSILVFGSLAAFGFIVVAILFQFSLGPIFIYAMIALACTYILYDTSNVLHHYRIGQHVAAALALFASVALLFWYVLQLVMSRRN
jgi:FtsH-binding integral membrane protein